MGKIIVVVGPTGIGKTKMSILLAKYYDGIIVNADSMQIYKDLNIGTSKVTDEEKENIPHYLFDIKSVKEEYNAFNYQEDLRIILKKYNSKNIIIVGGTGLYIKAGLYNYDFKKNVGKNELLYDAKFIGLTTTRDILYERINKRVDEMIKNGLIEEVKHFYDAKIKTKPLIKGIGYKELYDYFDNKISLEEAIINIKQNSRKYAKRQYTWYRHQMNIDWFNVDFNNFNNTFKEVIDYLNS